ncbi:MAG: AAA family ATPase [Bacteroidales bacterium]|nr:AAA family ATPase [Bacteroidales bacterium]
MSLDSLCKELNKKAKEDIVMYGVKKYDVTQVFPLSSPRANYSLYGGIPRGRLVEFFGDEGSGKTTTALDVCANAQKILQSEGKTVLFLDAENTYDPVWAEKLGVHSEDMVFIKPMSQTAEELFQFILDAIDTGEVGLVIIDSLGVLVSQQAYEKDISERTYGGISMALTAFSKKAEMLCHKHNCTIIGINQMRDNMSSMYGGTTTTGGRAWRHNCSLRIKFQRGDFFDEKGTKVNQSFENPAGNLIQMSVVKSKCFPNDRKTGFYRLHYYKGIMAIEDTIDVAMKYGFIVQGGAWYSLMDIQTGELIEKFQGMAKLVDYLEQNPKYLERLKEVTSDRSVL